MKLIDVKDKLIKDLTELNFELYRGKTTASRTINGKLRNGLFALEADGGYGVDTVIKFFFDGTWKRYGVIEYHAPFNIVWDKRGTSTVSPFPPYGAVEGSTWVQVNPDGSEIIRKLEEGEYNDLNHKFKKNFILPSKTVFVDGYHGDDGNDGGEKTPFKTIERAQEEVKNVFNVSIVLKSNIEVKSEISFLQHVSFSTFGGENRKIIHSDGRLIANSVVTSNDIDLLLEGEEGTSFLYGKRIDVEIKGSVVAHKLCSSLVDGYDIILEADITKSDGMEGKWVLGVDAGTRSEDIRHKVKTNIGVL